MAFTHPIPFHLKAGLLIIALGIIIGQNWHEFSGGWMMVLAIVFAVIGYWFGKITCAEHDHPGRGIALSIGLFVLLNGLHSLIDGVSLVASGTSWIAVIAHEIVRQLALYAVILGMIAPFPLARGWRVFLAMISVTVVWALAMFAGEHAASYFAGAPWLHPYLAAGAFLLVGDIVHHLVDEYRHA